MFFAPPDAELRTLRRRHKLMNGVQSVLLLGGMVALLAACGWIVAGGAGVLWTLLLGAVSLLLSPRVSPRMVLSLYGARRIGPYELPELHAIVAELGERAGLERLPELHYVPSRTMNAFAVGSPEKSAIAVTDGLLRRLDLRELAGVLAHELSHVRNNDLWVMGLADTVSRLTRLMSLAGQLLLIVNLPLVLIGQAAVPWLLVLLLVFAPTVGALLQLALSRTREYDADLDAAHLTGDPEGLASALAKLERHQGRFWESVLMPGRRVPDPSLLRTHPPTEERIRRLLELRPRRDPLRWRGAAALPVGFAPVDRRPRYRASGLWY